MSTSILTIFPLKLTLFSFTLDTIRAVSQYLTRGSNDPIIKDEAVKAYMDALVKSGQRVEYVQVGSASHAFFDWKPDKITRATFKKYGVYRCRQLEVFFNSVFY